MSARRRSPARGAAANANAGERPLAWPGDPAAVAAADVDFEAVAHVLANTCRWRGRTRRFYSLAQHAVAVSEEVEALDGLDDSDRRALALRALLAGVRAAWLGDGGGEAGKRAGAAIDRAVGEAAGLDPEAPGEQAEILRFVERMTDAAERRDVLEGDAPPWSGPAFPPLKRRLRPVRPAHAARLWIARFRELAGPSGGASGKGAAQPDTENDGKETADVAHLETRGRDEGTPPEREDARHAA